MTHSNQAAQFDQTETRELNADELELVTGGMFNVRELLAGARKVSNLAGTTVGAIASAQKHKHR